jgi:starch synthase
MKTGIMFADKITTVSPSYSYEIRRPEYGEGLQDYLNSRAGDLIGILNGVNYDEWNPEKDKYIYNRYTINTLKIKNENKIKYLTENGIEEPDNYDIPLFGMVTRLTGQKGIELLQHKLESFLMEDKIRFAILGQGDQHYIDYFNYLAWKYPKNAFVYIGYSEELAHRIISCSDFLLLPSKFEPCGLTQMYALKYGTIPIVRSTGGLADTVHEYIPETGIGNGFVFWNYNGDDMAFAIRRGLSIYRIKPHWDLIRKNGMKENFSSSRSALEYLKVFKWAMEKGKGV